MVSGVSQDNSALFLLTAVPSGCPHCVPLCGGFQPYVTETIDSAVAKKSLFSRARGPEVDSPGPLWWPRKAWLLPDSRCLAGLAQPPGLAGAAAPPVVTFRVGGEEQGERGPPRKSTASHDVTVRSPAKGADVTPSVPDMQEI